jgi:hypothetical protein
MRELRNRIEKPGSPWQEIGSDIGCYGAEQDR